MRIYPASHYTMGGLWVDYNLMTNIPGLFALGEANFSDHGANRLGASALMQGLADGYFVIPYTLGDYLATHQPADSLSTDHEAFKKAVSTVEDMTNKLLSIQGDTTPVEFHRALGKIVWDNVGMGRNEAGLRKAISEIRALREQFWVKLKVDGKADTLNKNLEFAGRVADYLELGELMAIDALDREESCGGHFREEHQKDGEAVRHDDKFCYVAGWKFTGDPSHPELHKEQLHFESIQLQQRSYK
jgi:succinate dehydrogenase / fumarate reductase flavoprotein subunit